MSFHSIPLFHLRQQNLLCLFSRDKFFFTLLRGYILDSETVADGEDDLDNLLANATVAISSSAVLPSGKKVPRDEFTIPLRTIAYSPWAHISIRGSTGEYMDHLTSGSMNDILTDFAIPRMFVERGTWKFRDNVPSLRMGGVCLRLSWCSGWRGEEESK